jgi:hypothetical protein
VSFGALNAGMFPSVKPDAILGVVDDYDPLDPCPSCGGSPHDAPEGHYGDPGGYAVPNVWSVDEQSGKRTRDYNHGDAVWQNPHCFKCGFRPGKNEAVDINQMKRQFEAFKAWALKEMQDTLQHPTVDASSLTPDQMAARKAQLEAELVGLNNAAEVTLAPGEAQVPRQGEK